MIHAYAALKKKSRLTPFAYEPAPLRPKDVRIQVTHCGVCHSDVHLIDNDWKLSRYPLVPGHEVIGRVTHKGRAVSHLKKGDRVGVGWQRGSCHACEWCKKGEENFCSESTATCVDGYGGYAEALIVDSRFAFRIPPALSSEQAAPLLCGGITVYAPLRSVGLKPGMRVGILGIGGLGHLALKFARAMKMNVAALSSSPAKKREAHAMGAHRFVAINDKEQLRRARESLDFLLSTTMADLNWNKLLDLLRPKGTLCFVGVPNKPLNVPVFRLLDGRKSICGSPIGGSRRIKEMLRFAARHRIAAVTERFPFAAANEAIARVRDQRIRYRAVLAHPLSKNVEQWPYEKAET